MSQFFKGDLQSVADRLLLEIDRKGVARVSVLRDIHTRICELLPAVASQEAGESAFVAAIEQARSEISNLAQENAELRQELELALAAYSELGDKALNMIADTKALEDSMALVVAESGDSPLMESITQMGWDELLKLSTDEGTFYLDVTALDPAAKAEVSMGVEISGKLPPGAVAYEDLPLFVRSRIQSPD